MIQAAVAKRKKAPPVAARGQHRRLRTQRVLFTILAVVIVASFIISLIT